MDTITILNPATSRMSKVHHQLPSCQLQGECTPSSVSIRPPPGSVDSTASFHTANFKVSELHHQPPSSHLQGRLTSSSATVLPPQRLVDSITRPHPANSKVSEGSITKFLTLLEAYPWYEILFTASQVWKLALVSVLHQAVASVGQAYVFFTIWQLYLFIIFNLINCSIPYSQKG